jgi:hypothetical protein
LPAIHHFIQVPSVARAGQCRRNRRAITGPNSVRVMALVIHPYIMRAPYRLKYFRNAVTHIQQHPGVLFWTGEQILDWYPEQRAGG